MTQRNSSLNCSSEMSTASSFHPPGRASHRTTDPRSTRDGESRAAGGAWARASARRSRYGPGPPDRKTWAQTTSVARRIRGTVQPEVDRLRLNASVRVRLPLTPLSRQWRPAHSATCG
jgi:hypothetical protein